MPRRWVENTQNGPRFIGGELCQPGEGAWVEDGPYAQPTQFPPVRQNPVTRELVGFDDQPIQGLVSGAGIRTLTLELATTDSILARLPDGRYIGTSNDVAGGFGGRFWVATGAPGALSKTGIAATNVAALKNTVGTVLSVGVVGCVWPLPNGDFIFSGQDGASRASLWYAKASGATFTVGANSPAHDDGVAVLDIGRTAGGHTGQVRALHERSMCRASIAGSQVLLFGEYNVASGRVPGAAFDQCRVMRSIDGGKTWSSLLTWNTNGTTSQMRHVHAVRQDPLSGSIYVLIGDNPWSSLIRWDGVSAAPPANTELAAFNNYPGWECLAGSEWNRSGDLLFSNMGAHYLIDNTEWGGFDRAMSAARFGPLAVTKSSKVDISARRDPLIGLPLPDGGGIWLSMWDTGIGATRGFDVWSTAEMRSWSRIGFIPDIGASGAVGVLNNVFWADGKIFVSQASGASRLVSGAYGGTLVFNADAYFDGTAKALA